MRRREAREIIIHEFERKSLGGASYDVRLGEWYYEANRDCSVDDFYDIYDKSHVNKVWGKRMETDTGIIWLPPHGNLLCHTEEFIGARRNATTTMKARSSIGRSMVNVCQCAGQGDPGFVNRWTMEIHNRGDWYIPLVVGRRIAQIVFDDTGPTSRIYGDSDKYQDGADLDELIRSWTPEMMLPRLWMDREVRG